MSAKLMVCVAVLALMGGCSAATTGTVEGTIYVDGTPLGGLEVAYKSDKDGSLALGATLEDGKYSLRMGRGNSNIPVGTYHVTVVPSGEVTGIAKPKIKLPSRFLQHDTTDLIQTVGPGANVLDLRLDTK